MTLHQNVFGVDVSKEWIDVFELSTGCSRRIDTTPRALAAFARASLGSLVVFEATGGCERPLREALEVKNVAYARVNPRHAREFARATGRLAKTDKVDARVLAQMGQALRLVPASPLDPARRRLSELVARREDLVSAITRETQRLAQARDAFVRRDIARVLAVLKTRRLAVDREISAQGRASDELSLLIQRLRSAPGIGPTIASVIAARLPELGRLDRRAIASLAGLAPHACDSGQRRGKRRVWGGRADVRRALYLAAFIASRCDPELRACRQRLTAAGKPFKTVIIAVARKLLIALNAMIREHRTYIQRPV